MTKTLWRLHDMIWKSDLMPKEAINLFDEAGLISNHAVYLKDIADADARKCIKFLNEKYQPKTK